MFSEVSPKEGTVVQILGVFCAIDEVPNLVLSKRVYRGQLTI